MAKKLKEYFDSECVTALAKKLSWESPKFPTSLFINSATSQLDRLELKGRVAEIGKAIYHHLLGNYSDKLLVLHKILGPENPDSYGTFNQYFWQWCLSSVVEQYGHENRDSSFDFIYELTKRSTGEFAVRPFFIDDPEYVLDRMEEWSQDSNFHVRRLSSEGIRPLLPWAKKCIHFVDKPKPIFKLLKRLSSDSEKYVLKSVANHMGDMIKLAYNPTFNELEKWSETDVKNTHWLIRHALRNPRSKGDKRAIKLSEKLS